jgi:Rrf2 family protein
MHVSRKVDYAMRALAHLAEADDRRVRISDLSVKIAVPKPFLANVMRDLVSKGLVRSQPGPCGGYTLARESSAISFRDLVEAVDGPMHIVPCQVEGDDNCILLDHCTQLPIWDRIRAEMLGVLEKYSLAQVSEQDRNRPLAEK